MNRPLAKALPTLESIPPRRGRLVLDHITKRFAPSAGAVIDDLSLTCEPGEFVVVVGPSGCGKSTLLNMAAGMIEPDGGAVMLDESPVTQPGPNRAVVFQDHALFPWLTAEQNIEFGLKMAAIAQGERRRRTEGALRMVHLTGSRDKLIHQLSGGMKQRIAIARALVMEPSVLLMDEPFAALDAQTRTLLHQQLQELFIQARTTVLFITHSVGEAVRLADRVIVLHAHPGRIRREIRIDLPHPRRLDSPALGELARLIRGEIEDEVNRIHAREADEDFWTPESPADLGDDFGMLGGGI